MSRRSCAHAAGSTPAAVFRKRRHAAMTDRPGLASQSRDDGQDSGRERVSRAAYELFCREGDRAVGFVGDTACGGTAKMPLYPNFPCKDELIREFLRRRGQLCTRDWLEAE